MLKRMEHKMLQKNGVDNILQGHYDDYIQEWEIDLGE